MTEKPWPEKLVHRIAENIRDVRKNRRKLSIAKLSEKTEQVGYKIGTSVLTNIEHHRRDTRFDITELLVIAAALEVPPISLLFPGAPDGDALPLPGVEARAIDAILWFSGETGEVQNYRDGEAPREANAGDEWKALIESRELVQKERLARSATNMAMLANLTKDNDQEVEKFMEMRRGFEKENAALRRRIAELDGAVAADQGDDAPR